MCVFFKMEKYPEHVFKKRLFYQRIDSQQQLTFITTQLSMTQIGLRGNGWFMITYSFLGSVSASIV